MANLILDYDEMEEVLNDLSDFSFSGSDEYIPSTSSGSDDEEIPVKSLPRKKIKNKKKIKFEESDLTEGGAAVSTPLQVMNNAEILPTNHAATSTHALQDISNTELLPNDSASASTQRGSKENLPINEVMDVKFIGPLEKPKKNRFANPVVWKKNVRKRSRNSGESYINVKGKIVPKKVCEEFDCHCRLKCAENITYAERCKNFERFYSNASWETQTAILASAVKVVAIKRKRKKEESRRSETREYYLKTSGSNDVVVCKSMFMKTLDVNSTRIHRALLKANCSNSFIDERGKHNPANATSDEKLLKIRQHISSFPAYKSHYRRSDTPDCKYLSSHLNMTVMYEMYRESIKNEHNSEKGDNGDAWQVNCVSINTYKRVFCREFNLKFKSPKKDTCKKCDCLKVQIDAEESKPNPENNVILAKLKSEQEHHHRRAEKSTTIRDEDVAEGKMGNVHVISFDLQKVFPLPKITTNEAYYKRQLSVLNFGIQNVASEQAYMFIWHEGIASRGPQEVASCLKKYVQQNVECTKLIAWSDACGGQNRNIKLVLAYMYLVAQPDIPLNTIVHKFCVSGHSYLANDRDFSQIENKIRKKDNIYSFEDFVEIVKSSKQNKRTFEVTKMSAEDFFSTRSLEKQITNRKKDVQKETVSWLRMMEIQVQKDKPGILQFKYTHDKEVPYYELDIRKKLNGVPPNFAGHALEYLHPQGHVISADKLKDIKHLLKYVPQIFHDFYLNLMPTENVEEEDSDGVVLEDFIFEAYED